MSAIHGMVNARKEREKALQDARFKVNDGSRGVEHFYGITGESHGYFQNRVAQLSRGKRLLEFGCGNGANALRLCGQAMHVAGIDISDVAVEIGKSRAAESGIDNVDFFAMDAEKLRFENDSFDVICGVGILHHLDLVRAYGELARTLRPSGHAIFIEPLGHNPVINLFRRVTPKIRTPDEHPLRQGELELASEFFGEVRLSYYHLCALAAAPFGASAFGNRLSRMLNRLDRRLFTAVPSMTKYAWFVVIEMSQPIKRPGI